MDVLTIGHSNHTWKAFAGLLSAHGVQVLVDVRTTPSSRFAPFADRRHLPKLLDDEGVKYVFLGKELGGKPDDHSLYDEKGKPDYRMMSQSSSFGRGIARLIELAEDATVALMCAEEDPAKCHRTRLLGPALVRYGVEQVHIRGDASLQSNEALASRKLQRDFQGALFTSADSS